MEKNSIFQNDKVKNFKNLQILQSKRDFFNFLQVITFDLFMLANWNFLLMFYTGNTTGKLGKNENWSFGVFYYYHSVLIFDRQMLSVWNVLHKLYAGNTTANKRVK